MNCIELISIIESLVGGVQSDNCAWTLDSAGNKHEFTEFAYAAKTEELAVQALFFRLISYAESMAYMQTYKPKDFDGRLRERVPIGSNLKQFCLVWRVKPEVRANDDGFTIYTRLVIYEMR